MQYQRRLRSRIVFSFVIFGTLLSGLFAASALSLQEYITDQLISRTLRDELNQYVGQLRVDPSQVEPFYTRIQGYVTRPNQADIVPEAFRDLPSGVHKVDSALGLYRAAIRKDNDFWVFLTYDVTANRSITQRLIAALVGTVLAFSVLSLALGWWSAGRVMQPVRDLADRVRRLSASNKPESLAQHFADDEVGQMAAALDTYAAELRERVERDNAFNADVSHELRTPLTVITGATELLLNMPEMPEKAQIRLFRIARAARQSTDITTALLHLARAERGVTEDSNARDLSSIVANVIELYEPLIGDKNLLIEADLQNRVNVIAPESVIAVTVGNLLGNAIRYSPSGVIRVSVRPGVVVIQDQGPGIDEQDLPRIFDRHYRGKDSGSKGVGLGLAIVKRLCELYGWQVRFQNAAEGGLRAEIWFYGQTEKNSSQ